LEYCSGNGHWIASKARENKDKNWVAIEMKFSRARKIWSKIKRQELDNLIVINGEGHKATANYIPDATIHQISINFPDPWPKRRHSKNRIIQPSFISEMARILTPKGSVIFVSDDDSYSDWTIEHFQKSGLFHSNFPAPFFTNEWPNYGDVSYFEDLWRNQGKIIRYHSFQKSC
jgi:tRNA (guanine-N7-)-methyltransferase